MATTPSTEPLPLISEAQRFPVNYEDFQADSRISWSRISNKWTLEADDGSEYEFDDSLKRWIPMLDESLAEQQSKIYAIEGIDEAEPAGPQRTKKRKVYTTNEDAEAAESTKKTKLAEKAKKMENSRVNKAVYVTNLPLDATEDDIQGVFSKCGVIAEEIDGGKPRIKIYRNEDGTLKGDALIIYFRPESVDLAIQMLDGTPLRHGTAEMRVQAADFSYKVQQDAPPKVNNKDKRKIIKKMQKLNHKLSDWDDDGSSMAPPKATKQDKTVILKHMFTLQELEDDPVAIIDLKEDIREECEKLGTVTNVVLFDKEKDGVVSVRFKDEESALACVKVMNGRFFDGQTVEAFISQGNEKFQKSSSKNADVEDGEEAERLEKFGSWLEAESK